MVPSGGELRLLVDSVSLGGMCSAGQVRRNIIGGEWVAQGRRVCKFDIPSSRFH